MPNGVSGNTNAASIVIGEKAADILAPELRVTRTIDLSHLTDDALLAEARRVVAHERQTTAEVIALLMITSP